MGSGRFRLLNLGSGFTPDYLLARGPDLAGTSGGLGNGFGNTKSVKVPLKRKKNAN